ncbi:hypothetical protein [Thiomicrorhabdus aquaedulcis]|uniref:hypothetical protein n=1 Tax=Thiomicrorhabdus aquaedulcis TaxID=2211106 RepID=UPI000FDBAB41|nr:hypothetical protein [Thiomicrorhabdus aquaedulcis]
MKNTINPTNTILTIALALGFGIAGGFAYNALTKEDAPRHNYAVLDIEKAISFTTLKQLEVVTDQDEVKQIVAKGRMNIEDWLATRLEAHCAAPCVVFNRADIVFGDAVDLNKQYEIEAGLK